MFKNLSAGPILKGLVAGIVLAAITIFALSQFGVVSASDDLPPMTVYQDPNCGCCGDWIDHLEENGFEVEAEFRNDMGNVKQQAGVPQHLSSCHTALVGDYVIEGHVPADDIKALLYNAPEGIQGLTVPGMPVGSPGMERGDRLDPYDVLSFTSDGATRVVASYGK